MIRFWDDRWLLDQTKLADVVTEELPKLLLEMKISEIISDEGEWVLRHFVPYLSQDMVRYVTSQVVKLDEEDKLEWRHILSKVSICESSYQGNIEEKWSWHLVWQLNIPQRCKMFLWLACKNVLMTNEARVQCDLTLDDECRR